MELLPRLAVATNRTLKNGLFQVKSSKSKTKKFQPTPFSTICLKKKSTPKSSCSKTTSISTCKTRYSKTSKWTTISHTVNVASASTKNAYVKASSTSIQAPGPNNTNKRCKDLKMKRPRWISRRKFWRRRRRGNAKKWYGRRSRRKLLNSVNCRLSQRLLQMNSEANKIYRNHNIRLRN